MNTSDTVSLFDYALARELIALDRESLLAFTLSHADELRARDRRRSVFVLPIDPRITRSTTEAFYDFYDDDSACTVWLLINDFCFHSDAHALNYWSTVGYLDDISSATPVTWKDVVREHAHVEWPDDSEIWEAMDRFDLLDADHVSLMIGSLKQNGDQVPPDEYTAELLHLEALRSKLAADPALRAAFTFNFSAYTPGN